MKKIQMITGIYFILAMFCVPVYGKDIEKKNTESIICASTTSTENSGLFDHILPIFKKAEGIHVKVVAVGTGAAIEMGKRGDCDVLIVHAKPLELKAVKEGFFVHRHDVMYNDFVIIGPKGDPAKIKNAKFAKGAFKMIATSGSPFVSRGDNSGTTIKELSVWKESEVNPKEEKWYMSAGQGMAKTIRIANEKLAYTITDRGTWLSLSDKNQMGLKILFEGDPILFNQYGAMAVNPEKYSSVKYDGAMKLINWLISKDGQNAINSFKDNAGNSLFKGNAKKNLPDK